MEQTVKQISVDIHTEQIEETVRRTIDKIVREEVREMVEGRIATEYESFLKLWMKEDRQEELQRRYDTILSNRIDNEISKIFRGSFFGFSYMDDKLDKESFLLGWKIALYINEVIKTKELKNIRGITEESIIERAGYSLAERIRMNNQRYSKLAEILQNHVAEGRKDE